MLRNWASFGMAVQGNGCWTHLHKASLLSQTHKTHSFKPKIVHHSTAFHLCLYMKREENIYLYDKKKMHRGKHLWDLFNTSKHVRADRSTEYILYAESAEQCLRRQITSGWRHESWVSLLKSKLPVTSNQAEKATASFLPLILTYTEGISSNFCSCCAAH